MKQYTDESIMPFGSKAGKQMKDLSDGYLEKLFLHQRNYLSAGFVNYLASRSNYLNWLVRRESHQIQKVDQ